MDREIRRSVLSGSVTAPRSPAMAHRAIVAASIADGQSVISGVPPVLNLHSTISACEEFGADILVREGIADIFGNPVPDAPKRIDCGECNTALKLLLPIAGLFVDEVSFKFSTRRNDFAKKMGPYAVYMEKMGVALLSARQDFSSFTIKGPIRENKLYYHPNLGTQFLSGLMLALPLTERDSVIYIDGRVPGIEYVGGTLDILEKCGVVARLADDDIIYLGSAVSYLPFKDYSVPASPYLSTYLLLAGFLSGKAEVKGVSLCPGFGELCMKFDIGVKEYPGRLLSETTVANGAELDAVKLGRFLPHAMVLASFAKGETKISNTFLISAKQRRRLKIMARELSRMGANIDETPDGLLITWGKMAGVEADPEGDPWVAMALSCAALIASGPTRVLGADCAEKSFPTFYKDLAALGAIVR